MVAVGAGVVKVVSLVVVRRVAMGKAAMMVAVIMVA